MSEPNYISLIHFFTGSLTLACGFLAMISVKGSRVHRLSGRSFVFLMSLLVMTGLWMSISREIVFTALLSMFTAYSFLTGWAAASTNRLAKIMTQSSPVISLAISMGAVFSGLIAASTETGLLDDLPPGAFYVVAVIALLSCLLDVRYLCLERPLLKTRLIRHAWRMGFSLFISTVIFFFGNNNVLPDYFRTPLYLSMPVILITVLTVGNCLLISFNSSWVLGKRRSLLSNKS